MKRAIIELGSNSIRLTKYLVSGSNMKEISKKRIPLRLSAYLTDENILPSEAMEQTCEILKLFNEEIQSGGYASPICIATEAVRRAKNRSVFLSHIKEATGFSFRVLSPEEEAYYGFLSIAYKVKAREFIMVDIGGGSAQFSLVCEGAVKKTVSLAIGAVQMKKQFIHTDPLQAAEYFQLMQFLYRQLSIASWLVQHQNLPIVAIGGCARCLAHLDHPSLVAIENHELNFDRLNSIYTLLLQKSEIERRKMAGMDETKVSAIIPGISILVLLMHILESDQLIIEECGMEGLLIDPNNPKKF